MPVHKSPHGCECLSFLAALSHWETSSASRKKIYPGKTSKPLNLCLFWAACEELRTLYAGMRRASKGNKPQGPGPVPAWA